MNFGIAGRLAGDLLDSSIGQAALGYGKQTIGVGKVGLNAVRRGYGNVLNKQQLIHKLAQDHGGEGIAAGVDDWARQLAEQTALNRKGYGWVGKKADAIGDAIGSIGANLENSARNPVLNAGMGVAGTGLGLMYALPMIMPRQEEQVQQQQLPNGIPPEYLAQLQAARSQRMAGDRMAPPQQPGELDPQNARFLENQLKRNIERDMFYLQNVQHYKGRDMGGMGGYE